MVEVVKATSSVVTGTLLEPTTDDEGVIVMLESKTML